MVEYNRLHLFWAERPNARFERKLWLRRAANCLESIPWKLRKKDPLFQELEAACARAGVGPMELKEHMQERRAAPWAKRQVLGSRALRSVLWPFTPIIALGSVAFLILLKAALLTGFMALIWWAISDKL